MKKIKLYDYQQQMLDAIIEILSGQQQGLFFDRQGRKMRKGNSVMVQINCADRGANLQEFLRLDRDVLVLHDKFRQEFLALLHLFCSEGYYHLYVAF